MDSFWNDVRAKVAAGRCDIKEGRWLNDSDSHAKVKSYMERLKKQLADRQQNATR